MKTIIEHFYHWEQAKPGEVYLRQPFGDSWKDYTWAETGLQARKMATALQGMGLKPGAHVGIVSKNCAHWIMADLAIMMGGFVSVPFFPNLTADQLKQVLVHSDVEVLFVGKLEEWESMKAGVPEHIKVIAFPHYAGNALIDRGMKWEDLLQQNAPLQQVSQPKLEDLWTVIYTSGTTGTPKGVMLSYFSVSGILESERDYKFIRLFEIPDHRFFSFLPLNHIAERMIVESASLLTGGVISFAESLDTFVKNLCDTQPTVFMAVPRIWTKFQMGILAKMPLKKLNVLLSIPGISALIRKKIKKGLGLNKAKVMLTGAAPTPVPLLKFFMKLGINLQEVYGMTENAAGCTINRPDNIRPGSVGQALPGVEMRVKEGTGEVLMKADWNMLGYYKAPEQTAEIIQDGWLHTGDRGEFDAEGFLFLKGRVKDAFKSAKGKYIVPGPIEGHFTKNPMIEQICVVGLGIPQPLALVVLSEVARSLPPQEVEESMKETLEIVNRKIAGYERVHRLIIVNENWDPSNKVLTPTLKVKRNVVDDLYSSYYEQWYENSEPIVRAEPVMNAPVNDSNRVELSD
jgi:long-chain acyl-CoA synthetase